MSDFETFCGMLSQNGTAFLIASYKKGLNIAIYRIGTNFNYSEE